MKLSAVMVAWTLVLSLALWYAYYRAWGERPEAGDTAVLVGIALVLVGGGSAARARFRRGGDKTR